MTQAAKIISEEEIFTFLKRTFVEEFEIDAQSISLEADLVSDLDIDSIDAVDLMISLKAHTGKVLDPQVFKQVRTVGDIVDAVFDLVSDRSPQ